MGSPRRSRVFARLTLIALWIATAVAIQNLAAEKDRVVWQPMERAVLKVDERPPRSWNLYHIHKNDRLLLVQLGRRFLMLDYRAHEIYELDPEKLERKDKDLLWHEADKPAKPLETSNWLVRDIGPLKRIRMTLAAEGRVLEVQIPIQPDMRPFY